MMNPESRGRAPMAGEGAQRPGDSQLSLPRVVQQGSHKSQNNSHSVRDGVAKMAQWRKVLAVQAW